MIICQPIVCSRAHRHLWKSYVKCSKYVDSVTVSPPYSDLGCIYYFDIDLSF